MLNNVGLPDLVLIGVVTLVLSGRGRISSVMGELGSGISAFKRGLKDEEEAERARIAAAAEEENAD